MLQHYCNSNRARPSYSNRTTTQQLNRTLPDRTESFRRQELAAESLLDAAFTYHAVQELRNTLRSLGSDLVVRSGDVGKEVVRLVEQVGASRVFFHKRYSIHLYFVIHLYSYTVPVDSSIVLVAPCYA